MVGNAVFSSFASGFKAGYDAGKQGYDAGKQAAEEEDYIFKGVLFPVPMYLKAETTFFPDSILNVKNGAMAPSQAQFVIVGRNLETPISFWTILGYILIALFSFGVLALCVVIPVKVYQIIRSIIKNDIFEIKNVRRMRVIGNCLLVMFAIGVYFMIFSTAQAKQLFAFENYRIVYEIGEDYYLLILGLITLLFAEILKISHTIKRENELTI
jgi:hypothetical protein